MSGNLQVEAKDPDQEQAEAFHEQYRFLVETLKAGFRDFMLPG